jgi:hypothetical protein
LGTPTGDYASGTVEEIEEHTKAGKPAMLYFSDAPVHPDSVDAEQYDKLKKFKEACRSKGLFDTYSDLNEFRTKFYRQLQITLNTHEYFKRHTVKSDDTQPEIAESRLPEIPRLCREAQVLLKEASQDPHGSIMAFSTMGGYFVQTNDKQMVEDSNPRNRAIWEAAIQELEDADLIKARGHKREVFAVTRKGYDVAELLNP